MKQTTKKQWIFKGLAWGIIMYALITFIFPLIGIDKSPITLTKSLVSLPIWLIGGLLFGFVTEKINPSYALKQKKQNHEKMG